ncbi:DUF92 domain-containing protein [Candidatus Neomarinimicrobiota bacterium]
MSPNFIVTIDYGKFPVLLSSVSQLQFTSSPLAVWAIFIVCVLFVLVVSELVSKRFSIDVDASRRTVHMLVGTLIFSARYVFSEPLYPLLTGLGFIAFNLVAMYAHQLPSIHATSRRTFGTVYFPLAFVILIILFWERSPLALQTGILLLTFPDPIAAIVGQRSKRPLYKLWQDTKTVPGTIALFLSAMLVFTLVALILEPGEIEHFPLSFKIYLIIMTGLVAVIAENLSREGSDNLTLPILPAIFIYFTIHMPIDRLPELIFWSAGSMAILFMALKLRALKVSGFFSAWLMGVYIATVGSLLWLIPVMVFFISSSILTRLDMANSFESKQYRKYDSGRRDWIQVIANGGVGLIIALIYGFWPDPRLYLVFLACFAAAAADTWATEIGSWSTHPPAMLTTFQPVKSGVSGGITLLGTIGSALGAFTIAISGSLLYDPFIGVTTIAIITLIGFSASLFDSLLGATVQVRFRLLDTGRISEKRPTAETYEIASGWSWLDNNAVNLMATASAALVGAALLLLAG